MIIVTLFEVIISEIIQDVCKDAGTEEMILQNTFYYKEPMIS